MKPMKRVLSFVIMLALIVGMVPMSAVTARAARAASGDAENDETKTIPSIVCDEEKVLHTDIDGGVGLFSFVPEVDGIYRFFSYDNDIDTYGYILDEDMNELKYDDDSAGNRNFAIVYKMNAGQQYYLKSRPYGGDSIGSYSVKVEQVVFTTIVCDEEKVLNTDIDGGIGLFSFVPEEDGVYRFFSYNHVIDTEGYILDEDMDMLKHGVDSAGYSNFEVFYEMNAGQQYYLKSQLRWSNSTGSYSVKVEQTASIQTIVCDEEKTLNTDIDGGVGLFSFVPEVDGVYRFFSDDNDIDTYGYILDEDMDELRCDDDSAGNRNFEIVYEMNAGQQYYLISRPYWIDFAGSYSYSVKVVKRPEISKLEITALPDRMDYDVDFEDASWRWDFDFHGLELKATFSDGSIVNWQYGSFADDINGYHFSQRYSKYGSEYVEYDISCGGETVSIMFHIKEKSIDHLELVSGTSKEAIEGYGYTNSDGQFIYYTDTPYDAVIKIVYKDGTSVTANVGDYVKDYSVEWDDNQEEHPWSVGTENPSTISYMGHTVNLPITVKENPVDHLELVSGTSAYYIENYGKYTNWNGQFVYRTDTPYDAVIKIVYKDGTSVTANVGDYVKGYYVQWDDNQEEHPWSVGTENPSTISYLGRTVNLPITVKENPVESIEVVSGKITCIENDERWYYRYQECCLPDIVVKINYINGTSKTVHVDSYYDTVVDGYAFEWSDDQDEVQWTLGDSNYLTLSYLGNTTQVPVSVIANPVDHIAINSAPTREYVYYGIYFEYFEAHGYYVFTPADLTGLSFTVYYTDGSSKTFTDNDIDNSYGVGGYIDGFGYRISYYWDLWNSIECGNLPVTFEYMGKSADYTVVLKESPVTSIEVTKNPVKMQYTYGYVPDYIGMELTITYKDGTTKVVALNEDNLVCDFHTMDDDYISYKVDVDGYPLIVGHKVMDPNGDWKICAEYCGVFCEIEDITYTQGKEISSVELAHVSWNGDGMTVNITYTDETTETLVLDLAGFFDENDEAFPYVASTACYCIARTANGLLKYYIETYTDEDGHIEKYIVDILGETIMVTHEPAIPGDADGDGKVSSKDVTLLQRYLVGGWDDTVDTAAADVNADGVVNSKDVTLLRRYLVGGWDVELK